MPKGQRCTLTYALPSDGRRVPCGDLYRDGRFFYGLMPNNSCALQFEINETAALHSCSAQLFPDGSAVLDLAGGGTFNVSNVGFYNLYAARVLSPPPLGVAERFDVALGCQEDKAVFDLRPGHSTHLGEVRGDTAQAGRVAELHALTGGDSRTIGALTFHLWSEKEVIGSVQGLSVLPDNSVRRIDMWFRLNWQTPGDPQRLTDCDPYKQGYL